MNTLDSIFAAFGGPAEIGRAIGKSTEHAAAMRRRGSIPVGYWQPLIRAAREKGLDGVTYESLALIHAPSTASTPDSAKAQQ